MIPLLRYTKFLDVYERYKALGQVEIPFFEDGKLLYDVLHKYVGSAIRTIYLQDTYRLEGHDFKDINKAILCDELVTKDEFAPSLNTNLNREACFKMCSESLRKDEYVTHFVESFFVQNADTPDFWPKAFRSAGQ